MENFSFRPSYEVDKTINSFFMPTPNYSDPFEALKTTLKFEAFSSPFYGPQDFAKNRLNSFDVPNFSSYPKEEILNDNNKIDNFILDGNQPQADQPIDLPFSTKMQDYPMDFYRINRSRGPSFNIGTGRKASEDFFGHGFDFLNSFQRNQEQQQRERGFSIEGVDAQMQSLLDFRGGNPMSGSFSTQIENPLTFGKYQNISSQEERKPDEINNLYSQVKGQQVNQEETTEDSENIEPEGKKKRKLNNSQEAPGIQVNRASLILTQGKKSKNEAIKGGKNTQKYKKNSKKKASDTEQVKSEIDDKSTVAASSINVSPNPKKESFNAPYMTTPIFNNLSSFKKPETAQELLGGLSLPAEVEEYINNSKIFNQIRAQQARKIGTLTVEERKVKLEKYLEKRKKRTFNKRVNYDCRKQVADSRLRVKGRFVTKEQALGMLAEMGIYPDPEKITQDEIKELLSERFGVASSKKGEKNFQGNNELNFANFEALGSFE